MRPFRTLRNKVADKTKVPRSVAVLAASAAVLLSVPIINLAGHARAATSTIFPSTLKPAVAVSTDTSAVELGVKFTSDTAGQITGIRFYKGGTGNGGTHYGHLWTMAGQQLAQAQFTNETSSGWQSVNFATPVSVAANTTYIASYYAPAGHYSYTSQGLKSAVNNPPLHAVANSTSPDGVYLYTGTPTGGFPNAAYNATNYFVDVNFTTGTADTTVPVVSITSPSNNAALSGQTTVNASASDDVGVTKVELYVDGALKSTSTSSPYSFALDTTSLTNGSHQLTAKAYDAAGNVGTSSAINVTVSQPDTTAPVVSITSPANNATVSGQVSVNTSASDNVGVTKVELYVDGTLSVTDTASPYAFTLDTTTLSNAAHQLSAKAYDAAGNVGASAVVNITVTQPDTTAPTISITSPTNNQMVSGVIQLQASTSDNTGVSSIQYLLDGTILVNQLQASPYTYNFDTTTVSNGTHTLTAQAIDASGNTGTSAPIIIDVENSVVAATPSTIWPLTAVPTHADSDDSNAVTLGVKFQSSQNGYVTGVRFYKGSASNGGTHTGQLWSSAGTLLAQATFSNESGSGWQTVAFTPGVAITAGTTYIASYFAPQAHYSFDVATDPGGLTAAVNNPPLTAPSSATSSGNDVYHYGSSASFPTDTYNSSNYWVDVFFSTTNTAPDTTGPAVSISSPATGATVSGITTLTASASDGTGVSYVQYYLDGAALGGKLTASPYSYSWDATATTNGTHTLTAKAADPYGNTASSSNVVITVANTAAPRPGTRGSGPVLTLTDPSNPFSDDYCSALLKTEGLPECAATDTGNLTSTFDLSPYRVIILAGGAPLTSGQVTLINNWVSAGGTFIAMHPGDNLDALLGIGQATGSVSDRYYKIDPAQLPGIETQSMQFHGTADQHVLAGATAMATLYSDANTATSYPAITTNNVGSGKAIAYMFDVSQSVLLTRNGNPALAGQVTVSGLFDGQPRFPDRFANGFLDTSKASVPQADELQRSLANMVENAATAPRLWYFPSVNGNTIKAALIMTGDDHNSSSQTLNRFATEQAASPAGCSFVAWTCYTSTSYAYPGAFSDSAAKPYTDAGFEVSLHAAEGTGCLADWSTQAQFDSIFTQDIANWQNAYPTISAAYSPLTERLHCYGIWKDYASIPKAEAAHGLLANVDSPCWPNQFLNVAQCYYTGTGMPEDFIDTNGSLVNLYQFTTNATDENPSTVTTDAINGLVTNATSAKEYYGYFSLLCHLDNQSISNQCHASALSVAQANNVPMISAKLAAQFWNGRNNASISSITYGASSLSFSVSAAISNMQVMLPVRYNAKSLGSITVGGNNVTYTTQTINGIQYAFVTVPSGTSNIAANYQ